MVMVVLFISMSLVLMVDDDNNVGGRGSEVARHCKCILVKIGLLAKSCMSRSL